MSASAAYTVKPKVGQCFMHSLDEVSAPYPRRNPISCLKTHNTEIYLVAKWPLSKSPAQMSRKDALEVVGSLCHPNGPDGLLVGTVFTYSAWFTPDPAAWDKGERWLRCDAMITATETGPLKFASWKGQKLKNRKNA